jgi:N-acetyl-anhydromuramyl-L-alanine amidase AmpD
VIKGLLSIADNVELTGVYAKHTRNCNQNSIGVAACCMFQARERPFRAGPAPMKELQFVRMAAVAAALCARYGIAIGPETLLGHGEVQETLGIAQDAKWDPLVLPWNRGLKKEEVGSLLRDLARSAPSN